MDIQPFQSQSQLRFNCTNMQDIKLLKLLGQGGNKAVYLGKYGDENVAVKMVTEEVLYVKDCKDAKRREQCLAIPQCLLMREAMMLTQLNHPNLIKLLGWCVRSEEYGVNMIDHGVIAVYELGSSDVESILLNMTWTQRLQAAIELTDLLGYLNHSPIGPIELQDCRLPQFVIINGHIKLTDLHPISVREPVCQIGPTNNCEKHNLSCIDNKCQGWNARNNLMCFNVCFFQHLLVNDEKEMHEKISVIKYRLDQLTINQAELGDLLRGLVHQ